MFVNHRQDDWEDWLPIAEFSYNNKVHTATKQTPFYVETGKHPRMGFEPIKGQRVEAAEDFAKRMKKVHEETTSALKKAADDMKRYADQRRSNAPEYKKGDMVWLEADNIKQNRPAKKLSDKRLGPYKITKVINPNAYELQLPKSFKIHNRFNVSKLRPYLPSTIPNQRPLPPLPVEVDGEEEYEAEEIIDSRLYRRKLQYLVKWKGYTPENNTWEPEANLRHSTELLENFYRRHPGAPRRIRSMGEKLTFHPLNNFTDESKTLEELTKTRHIPLGIPSHKHSQPGVRSKSEERGDANEDDENNEGGHRENNAHVSGCHDLNGG